LILRTSEDITEPINDISPQEGRRCLFGHRRQTRRRWNRPGSCSCSGASVRASADDDDGNTPHTWGHSGWRQHCNGQPVHDSHAPDTELRNEEDADIALDVSEESKSLRCEKKKQFKQESRRFIHPRKYDDPRVFRKYVFRRQLGAQTGAKYGFGGVCGSQHFHGFNASHHAFNDVMLSIMMQRSSLELNDVMLSIRDVCHWIYLDLFMVRAEIKLELVTNQNVIETSPL
jgi:hypothetical protein